ncbi:MAG: aspartate aminotransferase family protein [Gammaproteobacteria bacterium]|nr:aspartate aminotransferase family protein [Gammaproteobacteria bacterium]NIR83616.1 aspartate aminotransferase family protein [Gammaproteobacteria bacterium]NIR91589.1 aspartate aminotransferase family protein [Gammaproteobacteria bacterium]NIU04778.1 aspartate aminotransferase family protein [Gammaproteobacteria bacterium]NIV53128.1 aminotransferase class III-fold pyridoxal phosphate-dependent enzyme [Gammaproteobacteria bacterium]
MSTKARSTPSRHTTAEWQEMDRLHHLHPFTDFKALGTKGSRIITRADGVYLWDSDGNRILDGMAGLWCVNVGYGRKELAEAAYRQMLKLPYYNCFFQTSHPPAIELADLLAEVTQSQLNRVFYTNSGSEASDTVIRIVRRYWDLLGHPAKKTIISRVNAYHGSTLGGASLGGQRPMHEQGGLPIPGIAHIEQPYWYANGGDSTPEEYGRKAAAALEEKIDDLGVGNVAAFIGEPVQGAGGVIIPPETYWPEVQRICRKYGILLIVDEVICGFGRTGKWFGCDYYGLEPDLMPIAKGISSGYLPIGGVMVSDRVADVLIEHGDEFAHGYTFQGHPASCAVAAENIRILQREGIIENVERNTAPYLQARLRELADHPLVGEVRGLGFLGAIELVKDKSRREFFQPAGEVGTLCRDFCFDNGLIMRAVRDTMIVSPPLIMTKDQIDELVEKARHCIDLTARELGIV